MYALKPRVYLLYNVTYNCFRFSGRHLKFPVWANIGGYRPKSDGVGNESSVSSDPENLGITVETACLSVVERET